MLNQVSCCHVTLHFFRYSLHAIDLTVVKHVGNNDRHYWDLGSTPPLFALQGTPTGIVMGASMACYEFIGSVAQITGENQPPTLCLSQAKGRLFLPLHLSTSSLFTTIVNRRCCYQSMSLLLPSDLTRLSFSLLLLFPPVCVPLAISFFSTSTLSRSTSLQRQPRFRSMAFGLSVLHFPSSPPATLRHSWALVTCWW